MNLEKILESLHKIGLSKSEEEMFLITDEPKIPGYLCFPTDEVVKKYNTKDTFGQGFDPHRTKARIKAVAEFLERICLYNPEEIKFVVSKFNENKDFVDPASFFCYSEEQVPNKEEILDKISSAEYRWWSVTNLTDNNKYFIPAQMVFLSNIFDDEVQVRKERISTGAALGPLNTDYALNGGFMESIERDACISSYLTKRNLRRIIDLPDDIEELTEYLRRYQLEPHIFDATSDLNIPTVLVVTLDKTGIGAAVNVGSRSSATYEDAIKYAILESIHCRRTSRVMRHFRFSESLPKESEITCMDNRFFYWHSLERVNDLKFWLHNDESISYEDLKQKNMTFEQALSVVKSHGYNIFVADMTFPQIRDEGFEALKVIIPELHPLYLDERAKSLYSVHYGSIKEDKELKPHPLT